MLSSPLKYKPMRERKKLYSPVSTQNLSLSSIHSGGLNKYFLIEKHKALEYHTLVGSPSYTFEFRSSDRIYWSAVIISCTVNIVNEKICKCVWTNPAQVACVARGLGHSILPILNTSTFKQKNIIRVVIMLFSANILYMCYQ